MIFGARGRSSEDAIDGKSGVAGTTKWNGVEREERGEQSPRRKGKHEKGPGKRKKVKA